MGYTERKFRKKIKKFPKKKGGNPNEELIFYNHKNYGSIELGLNSKHAMSLHHNRLDLNIIANLNLKDRQKFNSIYKNNKEESLAFFANILKKYKLYSDNPDKKLELDQYLYDQSGIFGNRTFEEHFTPSPAGTFVKCPLFWNCDINKFLIVGESLTDPSNNIYTPIFLNDDDRGYFYDYNGIQYYPTIQTHQSKILKKTVYLFNKTTQDNLNILTIAPKVQAQYDGSDSTKINPSEFAGVFDNYVHQHGFMYMFDRARMTDAQKECIHTHFLDYEVLYDLNCDKSTVKESSKVNRYISDKHTNEAYRSGEQLNFFDINRVRQAISSWWPDNQDFNNIQYNRVYLVGFYEKDNQFRPVFLRPNGWFSDGYYDYSPSYDTIVITKEMLQNSNMYDSDGEHHGYLIGKKAYIFKYGTDTAWHLLYNQDFRKSSWERIQESAKYLTISATMSAAFSAGIYWSTAAIIPGLLVSFLLIKPLFFTAFTSYSSATQNMDSALDQDIFAKKGGKRRPKSRKRRKTKKILKVNKNLKYYY